MHILLTQPWSFWSCAGCKSSFLIFLSAWLHQPSPFMQSLSLPSTELWMNSHWQSQGLQLSLLSNALPPSPPRGRAWAGLLGTQGRQSCSPRQVTNDLTKSCGLAAHVGWSREPWESWHHGWSGCLHHLFAVCQQQALARCLLVPGFPCTWLAVLATASLFAFVVFPLIASVPSPSHSPSSPSFPQTCRHEPPAMSGSQLGAAASTHCRRDEETGNTIPINPGKAGKEPILVGLCRGF